MFDKSQQMFQIRLVGEVSEEQQHDFLFLWVL